MPASVALTAMSICGSYLATCKGLDCSSSWAIIDYTNLVRLDCRNLLVQLDVFANLLGELLQRALGDGLGHLGDLDRDGGGVVARLTHHGGQVVLEPARLVRVHQTRRANDAPGKHFLADGKGTAA